MSAVQIFEGMYDHHTTVSAVHAAWLRDRQAIDAWDDEGRTRARLAMIAANRCDQIRGPA